MKINLLFVSLILILKNVHAQDSGNKKKLQENCRSDNDCASGHCAGSFFKSKCVECEEHVDCGSDGFSPQGEAPVAFCTEENKCSKWARGKPIDEKGYALNIGGVTWIPRTIVDKPTGLEIIRFVMSEVPNADITVNGTHAFVPMNVHLQGEYAIENKVEGIKESGIVNLFFGKNPLSVILDNPSFGAGLKYHAIAVEGNTNTRSADRVKEELSKRWSWTNTLARKLRFQRDNAVAIAAKVTNAGGKLVEASQDITHMDQIRSFVKVDNGKSGVQELLTSAQYLKLVKQAKMAKVDSATVPSKKSMNHCRHWDNNSGVLFTGTHAVIPLETNLFAGAGQTEFSPSRWFGIAAGHTVFKYNKEDNALEMFQVWTEQMHVNMDAKVDQTGLVPAMLWLAPADGKDMKVSEVDGRTDEYYDDSSASVTVKTLLGAIDKIAPDYKRLYVDPDEACTDDEKERFHDDFEQAKTEMADPSFLETMWQAYHVVDATTDSVDCGVAYLRSPLKDSNAFDILEFAVWIHLIMETDVDNAYSLSLDSHWWDDGVTFPSTDEDVSSEEQLGEKKVSALTLDNSNRLH